jgi:hypothetical protein
MTATEAGTSEEDDDEDIGEEEEFADLQGDEEKERLFRLNLNQRGERRLQTNRATQVEDGLACINCMPLHE